MVINNYGYGWEEKVLLKGDEFVFAVIVYGPWLFNHYKKFACFIRLNKYRRQRLIIGDKRDGAATIILYPFHKNGPRLSFSK